MLRTVFPREGNYLVTLLFFFQCLPLVCPLSLRRSGESPADTEKGRPPDPEPPAASSHKIIITYTRPGSSSQERVSYEIFHRGHRQCLADVERPTLGDA
jgi:hypothetical protein